jgi:hypothetical protein
MTMKFIGEDNPRLIVGDIVYLKDNTKWFVIKSDVSVRPYHRYLYSRDYKVYITPYVDEHSYKEALENLEAWFEEVELTAFFVDFGPVEWRQE